MENYESTPIGMDASYTAIQHKLLHLDELLDVMKRIATCQEGLLAIAMEARADRVKMAAKMTEALKRPIQEKEQ